MRCIPQKNIYRYIVCPVSRTKAARSQELLMFLSQAAFRSGINVARVVGVCIYVEKAQRWGNRGTRLQVRDWLAASFFLSFFMQRNSDAETARESPCSYVASVYRAALSSGGWRCFG